MPKSGGLAPSLLIINGGTINDGTINGGTRSSSFQARQSFLKSFLQPPLKNNKYLKIKDSLYEM
jgi:hypothetical protein